MVFKSIPNQYVRFSNKTVIRMTNQKGFYFDENGLYETQNEVLIKVLSQHFDTVKMPNNEVATAPKEINEDEIRKRAKEKGVKSWHVKSIERLLEELGGE